MTTTPTPASQPSPAQDFESIAYRFFKDMSSEQRIKMLTVLLGWDATTMMEVTTHGDERRCLKHALKATEQQSPAQVEKLARNVVATYDDPHLSPVAVERAIGMLRKELGEQSPARSDKDAEPVPGAHHLTLENVAAVIKDLREIADGTTERSIYSRDWVTYSAVLALIMEWLAGQAQESAPSSDTIDTLEFKELLGAYGVTVGKKYPFSESDEGEFIAARAALVAYIDARRATAGTTAAPAQTVEGGASALRAEPASQRGIDPEAERGLNDPLYRKAVMIVRTSNRASISLVQRHLAIGYNRAARLLEAMEVCKVVSKQGPDGARTVLAAALDQSEATRCRAEGGVTRNKSSSELASNTATAAPDDGACAAALRKIIEMNRQHAQDQYGDANKAETWSCIVVAREALAATAAPGNLTGQVRALAEKWNQDALDSGFTGSEPANELFDLLEVLASNAGSAPAEPKYRLINPQDAIEATDEWLSNDTATWAVNPSRLFDGMQYVQWMLPARRRVAPSNSPAGAKEPK